MSTCYIVFHVFSSNRWWVPFAIFKGSFQQRWSHLAEGCRAEITSVDSLRRSMRHKRMLGWALGDGGKVVSWPVVLRHQGKGRNTRWKHWGPHTFKIIVCSHELVWNAEAGLCVESLVRSGYACLLVLEHVEVSNTTSETVRNLPLHVHLFCLVYGVI